MATVPPNGPPPKVPLTLRRFDEILGMTFDETDNILGDRQLAKGENSCIVGPPGAGKTRLIMQLAIAGIVGRDFLGLPVNGKSLRWLFLQVENSNRRLQIDLSYFKRWVDDDAAWKTVVDQCIVHTLENDTDGLVFLDNYMNREKLAEAIATTKPDIVPWDSLQNFAVGDLNKDNDMFKSLHEISMLTKHGNPHAIPLVIHHALTGRAGAIKAIGLEKGGYSRNSKALTAWTRSQINVAVASPDTYETVVLACGKCSNGKEFEPFAAKFNEDTHIYEPDEAFDIEKWLASVKKNKVDTHKIPDETVVEACEGSSMNKNDLFIGVKRKMGTDASQATVYRAIDRVVKARKLRFTKKTGTYARPSNGE